MFKIFLIYILILICFLHYKESKADFRFNVGKSEFVVFDNTIVDASTDKVPDTRVFRFKANKDTYVGVYECDDNILIMGIPNKSHKDVLLTPLNSFGRMVGDYVCTYPVETRYKLSDEVEQ
jgi:hypothetical protein